MSSSSADEDEIILFGEENGLQTETKQNGLNGISQEQVDSESESDEDEGQCLQQHFGSEAKQRNKERREMEERRMLDPEFYSLPPIEKLNINVDDGMELKKFGVVDSHIDILVKINPEKETPHLGYGSILFDNNRIPLGEIFEIFGTVEKTMYALRFNSKDEAAEKMPIGTDVFYALTETEITKEVFPQELAKLKFWDRSRNFRSKHDGSESSSSDEVFSDDEQERQYLAKKKQKTRHSGSTNSIPDSTRPAKRRRPNIDKNRSGGNNPFHLNHRPWGRQPTGFAPQPYSTPHPPGFYPSPFFPPQPFWLPYSFSSMPYPHLMPPPPPSLPPFSHFPPFLHAQHQIHHPSQTIPAEHQFFNDQNYKPQRPYRKDKDAK